MKAFCEPPITTSSPQPSISRGIVPSPVMASTTKIASVFLTMPGDGLDIMFGAGRSLRSLNENALRGGLGLQRGFDAIGCNDIAIFRFQHVRVEPVSLRNFHPALAEFAGCADDHLVAGREQIGDRSIHRACAGGRETQNVVRRAVHFLQVRQCRFVDVSELFGTVVNVRRHHGVQRRWIQRGRARRKKSLLANVHGKELESLEYQTHANPRPIAKRPGSGHEGQRRGSFERDPDDQDRAAEGARGFAASRSTTPPNSRF